MHEVSPSRATLRFSNFEVDLKAGELRKQGVKVKLQEQPFQILQVLLEHPGELVTREELQRRIWPADTFVDFDHGLYNAIKRLREALGDTADTPQFIETLPKRGYRFIGPVNGNGNFSVSPAEQAAAQSPQETPSTDPPSMDASPTVSHKWRRIVVGVLAATAAVVVILAVAPGRVAANVRHWLSPAPAVPAIHSLAVLPLQNLSGDPTQEYFADGMTEELITELSGISALKVISRTSSMRYKRTDKSLPEIARELQVDGIVEGSVVRDGNQVRITTQLIYAPEDKNVWAHSYERQLQDSLTLQSEVASAIAGAVRAQIAPDEKARLQIARSVNPKALDAYLRGEDHLNRIGRGSGSEEAEKAQEYFQQAIAEDPGFARVYVAMAQAYSELSAEKTPLVKTALEKALASDPNLSSAHESLAELKRDDWDWVGADREFRRALELDPNNALAYKEFGDFLMLMGHIEEGLNEQQRAQELDPRSSSLFQGLYYARQYDRHLFHVTEAIAMQPSVGYLHYWLAMNYAHRGMHKEAVEQFKTAATLYGLTGVASAADRGYAASGFAGAMRTIAKDFERLHTRGEGWLGFIPVFYALAGDREQALKWLQICYGEHDPTPDPLSIDPVWDPLRSDPRFKEILRREGLPEIDVAALETQ